MNPEELAGATWRKSSYSNNTAECVEVAFLVGGRVGLRDSKNADGPALVVTGDGWRAFRAGVRNGDFPQS